MFKNKAEEVSHGNLHETLVLVNKIQEDFNIWKKELNMIFGVLMETTGNGKYFLKIDYWNHHKKEFENSLPIIRHMTDSGISFIPKIIKTKDGYLYSSFRQGTAVVFEHIPGELSEDYSTAQLYNCLAKIYRLKTDGLELKTENFGTERIDTFLNLQRMPEVPAEVKTALSQNKDQLFLVDWDSCLLAPIERDAWIFICDKNEIKKINSILAKNGIDYVLEGNRLCYYCYDFFFHYLNEYLKSIIDAENEGRKGEITQGLIGYLTDCWIYKRLETADTLCCPSPLFLFQ